MQTTEIAEASDLDLDKQTEVDGLKLQISELIENLEKKREIINEQSKAVSFRRI